MQNDIASEAREWLRTVGDRQDPQTKLIRALAEENARFKKALEDIALSEWFWSRDEMVDLAAEALGVEGIHRA